MSHTTTLTKKNLKIVVVVRCETFNCPNRGQTVNTIDGFADFDAAQTFVDDFHEAHDHASDCCHACGNLGTAEAEIRCAFLDPGHTRHPRKRYEVEAVSDDGGDTHVSRLAVTGPFEDEEHLASVWEAAKAAAKALHPDDWGYADLVNVLLSWDLEVESTPPADLRVTL